MGKRVWLDDSRKPPFGYDLWAKTTPDAIRMLEEYDVEHISLDHDLFEEHYTDSFAAATMEEPPPLDRSKYKELTGYAVLEWMEENNRWVADISVHTLSPRGSHDMLTKLRLAAPDHVEFRRVKPHQ
jgi:hypothetical protein